MIVVGVLYLSVCLVVGVVVVVLSVDLWLWWEGWFYITGDGGILVVVVMVRGFPKQTPKEKNIFVYMAGIVWL